jgi:hypothetical protein
MAIYLFSGAHAPSRTTSLHTQLCSSDWVRFQRSSRDQPFQCPHKPATRRQRPHAHTHKTTLRPRHLKHTAPSRPRHRVLPAHKKHPHHTSNVDQDWQYSWSTHPVGPASRGKPSRVQDAGGSEDTQHAVGFRGRGHNGEKKDVEAILPHNLSTAVSFRPPDATANCLSPTEGQQKSNNIVVCGLQLELQPNPRTP